jgi:hypothetical protein
MENAVEETGLDVLDLRTDAVFAKRNLHSRDIGAQMAGLQRLSRAMLERPDTILQELVSAAVDLCEADSAGISIEKEDGSDEQFYHWIATAGDYSAFLGAILPRYPSACGLCLERGHPQHFTVSKRFFDILNVEAPLVTDGILLPWQAEGTRGTIFVMAHGRTEAFDSNDARLMTMLSLAERMHSRAGGSDPSHEAVSDAVADDRDITPDQKTRNSLTRHCIELPLKSAQYS